MVGELLALRVRVIELPLGVNLVLEGMVFGLDMVVIAEVAVFVGVKLIESVFVGVKLIESVFVGVKLIESVFVGVKLIESVFVGVKLIESGFVVVKLLLGAMVVRLKMVVIAAVELFV